MEKGKRGSATKSVGLYERHLKSRKDFMRRNRDGVIMLKGKEVPFENGRMGLLKFYLCYHLKPETALHDWYVIHHDVKNHSGKHRHQGGLCIFVVEGRGYTVIDGKRYDWKKGDLILLPVKPNGVEHQHFNTQPGTPCIWMAFINLTMYEQVASYTEMLEDSPNYRKN